MRMFGTIIAAILSIAIVPGTAVAKPRARDLGVPFDGTPGQFNAITDVEGVEVGQLADPESK